jgi:hypothetical protein
MKKVILALAFVATLTFLSCKETTEDKVEDSMESVGNDIENGLEDAGDAIDSTATKMGNDIEEGVEEMEKK